MQISFELSDDVVQQLMDIPNLDNFINEVILNALQNQKMVKEKNFEMGIAAGA